MLRIDYANIEYAVEGKIIDLAVAVADTNKRGLQKKYIDQAATLLYYLEAVGYKDYIEDEQVNNIYECMKSVSGIYDFPVAPITPLLNPPTINVGTPGADGATGATGPQGPQGETGLATDFQLTPITVTSTVDSFTVSDASGARWDYVVKKSTNEQRSGSVIATWSTDGSSIEYFDTSTSDIVGSTSDLEFVVDFSGGSIRLRAVPASGTWSVVGSRYFIPNNGNGSGPVGDVLANGKIYIGDVTNTAQPQTMSGVVTISNTGVTSFVAGSITNTAVNASANIAVSKLASVTASRLLVSDGSGKLSASVVTSTEAGYLSGVTSAIQTQINGKLTDPTTTIGDIIIRNGAGSIDRLAIGSSNQVLTVSGGVPTWQNVPGGISGLTTGFLPKATSATTIGNSIISESGSAITIAGTAEIQSGLRTAAAGVYLKMLVLEIGDWNMDTTSFVAITHGLPDFTKVRSVQAIIRNDANTDYRPINLVNFTTGANNGGSFGQIGTTTITLTRVDSGFYDGPAYDSTSYNRGWVTIWYEA